jgi:hypothetical protein
MGIASFVGEIPSPLALNTWLSHLNQKNGGKPNHLQYFVGKRFFHIKN